MDVEDHILTVYDLAIENKVEVNCIYIVTIE